MPIGSILGGIISQGGNQAAAGQVGGATQQTQQNVNSQISQDRSYLSPWAQVGNAAVNQLAGLYGLGHLDATPSGAAINGGNYQADQQNALARFQTSPGYQFRVQQGVNAIDRSGAARGMLLSGAQQKALSDYGQNTGSAEYGNYVNQLGQLSGGGLGAVESGNNTTAGLTNAGNAALLGGTEAQAGFNAASQNALAAGIKGGVNSAASLAAFGLGGGFGGFGTQAGGLGAGGAQVPGGITGNALGGYSFPSQVLA